MSKAHEQQPTVSVLTPSLNQARWLPDAIGSVAAQTYPAVEHLVADGGSTDGSIDYLRQAKGVVWWTGQDAGQSAALNEAYRRSTGTIIGWLNADDAYFHVEVVERVVSAFRTNADVDVVYGHAALVNGAGLILHYLWAPPFSRTLLRRFNFIVQPTVFVRRAALGAAIADERYGYAMDRELWLRLSERCRYLRLNDVLAVDRHHPGRKSYLQTDVLGADQVALAERYGVPVPSGLRLGARALKFALRVRGATLLLRSSPELAFAAKRDGFGHVLRRQVAMRRASMPLEWGSR